MRLLNNFIHQKSKIWPTICCGYGNIDETLLGSSLLGHLYNNRSNTLRTFLQKCS